MKRFWIFLTLWLLCASAVSGQGDFSWLEGYRPIYGPAIRPNQLRGKVVMVVYWGINCPPCRAIMPEIRDAQAQYGLTKKFYVIGSHRQQPSDEVQGYLSSKGINFPVYQSLSHPTVESPGGIPFAFLIDKAGEVVAQGHPAQLFSKISVLVAQSPPPGVGGVSTYGLLENPLSNLDTGNVKNVMGFFEPGKPWAVPYKKMAAGAKKKGADDSLKTVLTAVDTYILEEVQKLEEMSKKKPAEAYACLTVLGKSAKGTPKSKEIQPLMKELGKDGNVKALASLLLKITVYDTFVVEMDAKMREKQGKQLTQNLQKFLDKDDLDKKLAVEAKKAMKVVREIAAGDEETGIAAPEEEEGASPRAKITSRKKSPPNDDMD